MSKGRKSARMTIQRPRTHASPPAWLRVDEIPALSVIVPTRNEVGNIRPLLARLEDAVGGIYAEVLVVDDSDDSTPEIARQIATRSTLPIRVHARPPEQRTGGLGGAVLVGLSEALGPVCAVMDADLQHPPELLEALLRVSRTGVDFVIASRYMDGGGTEGLGGRYRRVVSVLATWIAKRVLRPELAGISDPMSGFFLVRQSCLDLPSLCPQGFKLLLELLVHSPRASVAEVPYTFGARHSGVSKADVREGFTYLRRLAGLRAQARRAPHRPRRQLIPAASEVSAEGPSFSPKITAAGSASDQEGTYSRPGRRLRT
jgi:dolichol-phosphate mannosyltransferase